MMKRKWLWLPTAAVALTLAACGSKTTTVTTTEGADKSKFVSEVTHDGEPIKGGTLKYALVSASPINGLFIDELASDTTDSSVAGMIDESMFEYDENRKLVNSGLASISFDVEGKTATVKLNSQDYKWSDGEKVTIDDYIFTYEGIGHKDYTGVRYDGDFKNIEGMEEYHKGSASTISGLEKLDDYTVKIHYKEMTPSMQLAGGAVSSYVMPKHVFSKIPVAEWEQSDAVRGKSNVGLGAYTIEAMVPGESVTFVPNTNYYKGRSNLDKVVMEVVSPDSIVSEMKAGKYDIASMPSAQYDSFKDLTNVTFVSSLQSAYEYIGFKLGKWDKEQGKNIVNPNAKMSDVALRQAIAYAIDPDTAGKNLYNGLQHGTNSIIIPFFQDIYNKNQEGFAYNPEKAKKLLDDAGYKDKDGDGLREDKNGNKLSFNFAIRNTGAEYDQALADVFLKSWKEVGLDVKLADGKLMSPKDFSQRVQADDPSIDIFQGAWQFGTNPNRQELLGKKAPLNLYRYTTEAFENSFKAQGSADMFDDAKLKAAYNKFDGEVAEELPFFPLSWDTSITFFNKRVKSYDLAKAKKNQFKLYDIELTANEGAK